MAFGREPKATLARSEVNPLFSVRGGSLGSPRVAAPPALVRLLERDLQPVEGVEPGGEGGLDDGAFVVTHVERRALVDAPEQGLVLGRVELQLQQGGDGDGVEVVLLLLGERVGIGVAVVGARQGKRPTRSRREASHLY